MVEVMPGPPDDQFRLKRWMDRQRERRQQAIYLGQPGILLPRPDPHYHLMYNGNPDFKIGYETQTLAVRAMRALADEHEEKSGEVLYYEDMPIIQILGANVRGRTGKFDVMIQLGECRGRCRNVAKVQTQEEQN